MVFRRILEVQNDLKSEKEKLAADSQYWISFLQGSSRHYKHSFDEQIMINLKHPEFTACADFESWKSIGRSIETNHTSGVATIHNGKIRWLFNITQTAGQRVPWIWEINDSRLNTDYSNAVSDFLAEKYNLTSEAFEERLYELVLSRTAEILNDDKSDFFKLVSESAAYTIIYRCCPGTAEPSIENLAALNKYSIDETGNAVINVTASVFSEIESIVKSERQNTIENIRRNEHGKGNENNRRSETYNESEDREIYAGYDNGRRDDLHTSRGDVHILPILEGSALRGDNSGRTPGISGDGGRINEGISYGEENPGTDRSRIYNSSAGGNDRGLLQNGTGLLQTDTGGASGRDAPREIRNSQEGISSSGEAGTVHVLQGNGYAEQTSDGDKSTGTRNGRYDNGQAQGEQPGIQGSGESRRLSENSAAQPQLSENSGRGNSQGSNIQIIGNTVYRYIPKKTYRKYNKETGLKIAEELEKSGVKFSGKIADDIITFTVSKTDIEKFESIAHNISGEKEQFDITQADIDILRSLEPRKSVLNFSEDEIKLTENWQKRFDSDIHKKSPYYRAINGDWRENDDSKISVIQAEDRHADFKTVSDDIKSQIIPRGNIINNDTAWTIQVSRRGLEDSLTYARKHNDSAVYNMLYSINDIIEKSVLLDSVVSEKNNNNKANNTAFMHKMYNICRINDEAYLVKLAVEEFSDSQSGTLKRLYNVQDIKIEPLRHAAFTETHQLALSVLNGTKISIADLFKIVKDTDKEFYVNKRKDEKEIETSVKDSLELSLEFSESYEVKIFQEEYLKGEPISFALGNALFEYLDEKQHIEREIPELNAGWYHKTGFRVDAVINGEEFGYEGRYDIGDGKDEGNGTIVNHIRNYNEIMVKENPYHLDSEEIKAKQEVLDKFIPFLKEHSALNENEQHIFNAFKEKYPIRHEAVLQNMSELQNAAVESTADYSNAVFQTVSLMNDAAEIQDADEAISTESEFRVEDTVDEVKDIPEEQSLSAEKRNSDNVIEQLSLFGEKASISYEPDLIEKAVTDVLLSGSGFADGKLRIEKFCKENHTVKDFAKMLKEEYGIGGRSGNEFYSFVNYNNKGIEIVLNRKFDNEEGRKVNLSWVEAARRISELVSEGRYISQEEESRSGDSSEKSEKASQSDYRIEESDLSAGGAKAQFRRNIEAIKILKNPDKQDSSGLTDADRKALTEYAGWGGISQAFDPKNEKWSKEYAQLKDILNEEEYVLARASVLDAFYTPPFIIEAMYMALKNMGFTGGAVLEPAAGTGNFLGKMPDEMYKKSRIYAAEKDSVSGRICQLLYPKADVSIAGYEKKDFSDNFFDAAVGNIPFGSAKLADRRYDKYNFAVHDYFFAKTLDKVRPGGIVAFITSTGTLDKQNPSVRKYISQRAELLGAVRLPNNAFKSYAGTEVTADIIFLQKRERMIDIAPEWVYTGVDSNGLTMNNYFIEHPEMILGETVEGNKLYGRGIMVKPFENAELQDLLNTAVQNIQGRYTAEKAVIAVPSGKSKNKFEPEILPADPNVKNFSYTEINGKIFYRENSIMTEINQIGKKLERLKGMTAIAKCVRELLDMQLSDFSDEALADKRRELNEIYDNFTKKNGLLNNKTNKEVFREDVSLPLLLSLERVKNGKLIRKADIFTKRTLKPPVKITHAETSADALAVSISEKAGVDLEFMSGLMDGKAKEEIIADLKGVIYLNPESSVWETADEYLSGNIRKKLAAAKSYAETNPEFKENIAALENALPDRIEAGDIQAKLGSPWIDDKYIEQFMYELFDTPRLSRNLGISNKYIGINHNQYSAKWSIMNKSLDSGNVKVNTAYGTSRKNGYEILEDSLNMVDTTVRDKVYNPEKEKDEYVINHDETLLARQKQEQIEQAFKEWIFKDLQRREYLVDKYNNIYNSIRPREYDGSHLTFDGMNPEITLKKHQRDAVAHALYGGNTLFAHKVGAGKSYEMIAAAMEGKRLGLHNKSLIAVPNHMTRQMANDFLELYPNANILVADEKDFDKDNRQKLCAKIATGDFDAVIIGHSQLIKIPISKEREEQFLRVQIDELVNDIAEMKSQKAENFTIKDMERTRKNYEEKLEKLMTQTKRDDVVTFEQMGVDKLFIDEADMFKNLGVNTKMRNISGVAANRNVQKTQDLYVKCQYLDELTNSKGIVFATGTPVSNSISELYTMQKYLQNDYLKECGLTHFDAWAANYAQKVTKLEYAPTGKGFRQKTRLSKFNNLPELMTAFKECADIKTAEDLNLPEPECERHIVAAMPSEIQKDMITSLSERAENVHNKKVTPEIDNMLKITTDGIKIGLDQRLVNPLLPDNPDSKVNTCVNNVMQIWEETKAKRLTQVIFCDYSTPKKNGSFNLYDDVKSKLISKGIPEDEIAFIHDYQKPEDKEALFEKVREGEIRIVLGSTQKMGAGTNIQNRLYATHHLDAPWKPRDMEQRLGRMKRQGNINEKVHEYIYVTKETFDSYRFQTLETKQRFISQIMTNKNPIRACEDISSAALEFAEVKALCAGNPLIQEKMELDIEVAKLQTLKAAHQNQQYRLEDNILKIIPQKISSAQENLKAADKDSKTAVKNPVKYDSEGSIIFSGMRINNHLYTDKKEAGEALINAAVKALSNDKNSTACIADYRGFRLEVLFDALSNEIKLDVKGSGNYRIVLGNSDIGNITKIDNVINHIPDRAEEFKTEIEKLNTQLEESKAELSKPFPKEQELKDKLARQAKLDKELNLDNKENLLGEDNTKSFELETDADRKRIEKSKNNGFDLDLESL